MQPEAPLKVHVLTNAGRLIGVASVIRLLQSESVTPIVDIMDTDPVRVTPVADLTEVAVLMADYNLATIPVVDDADHVVGVVTVDAVLEASIPDDWRRRAPAQIGRASSRERGGQD